MKKKFFSAALLMLLAAALMIFATGCGARSEKTEPSTVPQEEQPQVQSTQAPADMQNLSLKDWTLEPTVWSDGNGATVSFTATPSAYIDGLRAALSIRIGELEAESTNCNWDGSAFTGSVELSAADGYGYYCILFLPDGTALEFELTTPENIVDESLVNMGSSLTAYANLVVEDWAATASDLTIKSGFVQCQLPRLPFNGAASEITAASLVLKLNDTEIARQELDIPAGEGEGSFEMSLENQTFALPSMENDSQLNLWLEISLSTGSMVTVSGGSWYSTGSELQMVVG